MGFEQAYASLVGLAVGDAFGAQILLPGEHPEILERRLPPAPWRWTDDTEMACSIFNVLSRHGEIDQDALAGAFAAHCDPARDYGRGAERRLARVRAGEPWREVAVDGRASWGNGFSPGTNSRLVVAFLTSRLFGSMVFRPSTVKA